MKKFISLILSAMLAINTFAVVSFTNITSAQAADYAATLRNKGFPEIYISDLVKLHNKYPNWIFEPLDTGLDWSAAVEGERSRGNTPMHNKQLIQNISQYHSSMFCKCSSCYKNGSYIVKEKPNWVSASQEAVEYYMNPTNWLDEKHIFQFESTAYDGTQTLAGIETILDGTWMHNSKISYVDKNGKTQTVKISGKEYTYAESILRAANYSGMSAYYLASKIRQEVGGAKPTAGGASGTTKNYPGIYNYYNICAYTGAEDGLRWASQSSTGYITNCQCRLRQGPSTSTAQLAMLDEGTAVNYISTTSKQSDGYTWYKVSVGSKEGYIRSDLVDHKSSDPYGRPWTDPDKSIFYGARYISNNFSTQDSGYLQKFNVNPESSTLHEHEYMANVAAASSESVSTYNAYKNANILGVTKTFRIPVFKNMPGDQHNYTTKVVKAATTTEDGLIEKTCSHCGDVIKEIVPKVSQIKRSWSSIQCVGTVQRPSITISDSKGNALVYKQDFTVDYSDWNSKDAGKYTVTVNLIGKYTGSYTYDYEITKNTKPVTFSQSRTVINYTGTVQRPSITATNNYGWSIDYKKDFTVDYSDWYSTDVGKYTVTAKTTGNNYNSYSSTMSYEIVPQTNVTPVLNRNVITTTGTVQRPTVTVTDVYGNKLEYKKDFTVDYSDWYSTDVGRYTVTVKMQGNYSGEKTYPYYINPKPTTFLSSAQGGFKGLKNGFTLTWNKQNSQTTGYQIQYATKRDFSNAASYWVEDPEITTATITGRAAETRYYVRIRPYTQIGNGTFYGSWDYENSYIKSIVTM